MKINVADLASQNNYWPSDWCWAWDKKQVSLSEICEKTGQPGLAFWALYSAPEWRAVLKEIVRVVLPLCIKPVPTEYALGDDPGACYVRLRRTWEDHHRLVSQKFDIMLASVISNMGL